MVSCFVLMAEREVSRKIGAEDRREVSGTVWVSTGVGSSLPRGFWLWCPSLDLLGDWDDKNTGMRTDNTG